MVSLTVKMVLMDHIMDGVNIVARTKMNSAIITNVSSLNTEDLKKELLWLNSYDTEWSKEISNLIKEELKIRDTQAQPT
jgi:NurA-like 5'-3' nuclease